MLSTILNGLVPFLLLPVMLWYLTPEEYGRAYFYTTLVSVIGLIVPLGVHNILQIYFHDRKSEFTEYLSSSWIFPLIFILALLILSVIFLDDLSSWLEVSPFWVLLVSVMALSLFVSQVALMLARNEEQPLIYGSIQISGTAINLLVSVILIALFSFSFYGRLYGYLFGLASAGVLGYFLVIRKRINIQSVSLKKGYKLFYLGAPLIVHNISGFIINKSDVFFVDHFLGKSELGIYSAGYQIGMVIMVLQAAMSDALQPFFFSRLSIGDRINDFEIVKQSRLFLIFLLLTAFGVAFLGPYFFKFFKTEYLESAKYIPWIAFAYFFLGAYKLFSMVLFYYQRTWIISMATFIAAIVNIVANYFLIQLYGAIGVAIATTFSMFLLMIFTFFTAQKSHPLPWLKFRH